MTVIRNTLDINLCDNTKGLMSIKDDFDTLDHGTTARHLKRAFIDKKIIFCSEIRYHDLPVCQ